MSEKKNLVKTLEIKWTGPTLYVDIYNSGCIYHPDKGWEPRFTWTVYRKVFVKGREIEVNRLFSSQIAAAAVLLTRVEQALAGLEEEVRNWPTPNGELASQERS